MGYEVLTAFLLEAGFLGGHAVQHQQSAKSHISAPLHGRARRAHLGHMDHRREQLNADAGRIRDQRHEAVRAGARVDAKRGRGTRPP